MELNVWIWHRELCVHVCLQRGALYSYWPSVPAVQCLQFVQVGHVGGFSSCQLTRCYLAELMRRKTRVREQATASGNAVEDASGVKQISCYKWFDPQTICKLNSGSRLAGWNVMSPVNFCFCDTAGAKSSDFLPAAGTLMLYERSCEQETRIDELINGKRLCVDERNWRMGQWFSASFLLQADIFLLIRSHENNMTSDQILIRKSSQRSSENLSNVGSVLFTLVWTDENIWKPVEAAARINLNYKMRIWLRNVLIKEIFFYICLSFCSCDCCQSPWMPSLRATAARFRGSSAPKNTV